DDVVLRAAVDGVDAVGVADARRRLFVTAADELVFTVLAVHRVVAGIAFAVVVAAASEDGVVGDPAVTGVVVVTAEDDVIAAGSRGQAREIERYPDAADEVPVVADDGVLSGIAGEDVTFVGAAGEARTTDDHVVADAAGGEVGAVVALDLVSAVVAVHGV